MLHPVIDGVWVGLEKEKEILYANDTAEFSAKERNPQILANSKTCLPLVTDICQMGSSLQMILSDKDV